jgi:SAM-dependent methyltransferase
LRIVFYTAAGEASDPTYWQRYWEGTENFYQNGVTRLPEYAVLRRHFRDGSFLLDAGCGKGYMVRRLLADGYRVRGLDFDQGSVLDAVRRSGHFPADVADLNRLPYQDGTFDGVVIAGTIEHIPDGIEPGLRETFRVLRPGGALVLTIPYINPVRKACLPFYLLREALGWKPSRRFHQYVFSRGSVLAALKEVGFTVQECQRAYYTTVLFKIPGVNHLRRWLLGEGRPATSGAAVNRPAASPKASWRKPVKTTMEWCLNAVIANRLLVVARKGHSEETRAA